MGEESAHSVSVFLLNALDAAGRFPDSGIFDFERKRVGPSASRRPQPATAPGRAARAIPDDEFGHLVKCGTSLLVRGEASATMATVVALGVDLPTPLAIWIAGTDSDLPPLDHGTIVLQEVDRLSLTEQSALLVWLDDHVGAVCVITTAARDLFALVTAGTFMGPLYYRLNTIVVDAIDADPRSYRDSVVRPMPASAPTAEEVAERAYEIFLARGGEPGHDLDDWFEAESELLSHCRRW